MEFLRSIILEPQAERSVIWTAGRKDMDGEQRSSITIIPEAHLSARLKAIIWYSFAIVAEGPICDKI